MGCEQIYVIEAPCASSYPPIHQHEAGILAWQTHAAPLASGIAAALPKRGMPVRRLGNALAGNAMAEAIVQPVSAAAAN
ncbi:hypothetical protein G6F56_014629 [Rhizopus delemar]|nr:hypothetical protein G6F56_014629 [Rhizopus delemar]